MVCALLLYMKLPLCVSVSYITDSRVLYVVTSVGLLVTGFGLVTA